MTDQEKAAVKRLIWACQLVETGDPESVEECITALKRTDEAWTVKEIKSWSK
jgi:hypothetical protein